MRAEAGALRIEPAGNHVGELDDEGRDEAVVVAGPVRGAGEIHVDPLGIEGKRGALARLPADDGGDKAFLLVVEIAVATAVEIRCVDAVGERAGAVQRTGRADLRAVVFPRADIEFKVTRALSRGLLRYGVGDTAGIELAVKHGGGTVDHLDAGNVGRVEAAEVRVAVTGAEKRGKPADGVALEIPGRSPLRGADAGGEADDVIDFGQTVVLEQLLGEHVDRDGHLLEFGGDLGGADGIGGGIARFGFRLNRERGHDDRGFFPGLGGQGRLGDAGERDY